MSESLEVKPRYQESVAAKPAEPHGGPSAVQAVAAPAAASMFSGISTKYFVIFIVVCLLLIGLTVYALWPAKKTGSWQKQKHNTAQSGQQSQQSGQNNQQSAQTEQQNGQQSEQNNQQSCQSPQQSPQQPAQQKTKLSDKKTLAELLERSKENPVSRASKSEEEIMSLMESEEEQCAVESTNVADNTKSTNSANNINSTNSANNINSTKSTNNTNNITSTNSNQQENSDDVFVA